MSIGQEKILRRLRLANLKPVWAILVSLVLYGQTPPAGDAKGPAFSFLSESSVWEGAFTNFVNQADGKIQEGQIRIKVEVARLSHLSPFVEESVRRMGYGSRDLSFNEHLILRGDGERRLRLAASIITDSRQIEGKK